MIGEQGRKRAEREETTASPDPSSGATRSHDTLAVLSVSSWSSRTRSNPSRETRVKAAYHPLRRAFTAEDRSAQTAVMPPLEQRKSAATRFAAGLHAVRHPQGSYVVVSHTVMRLLHLVRDFPRLKRVILFQ